MLVFIYVYVQLGHIAEPKSFKDFLKIFFKKYPVMFK